MYEILAVLAVCGTIYGIFAGGIERTHLTGPMVFIALGLFVGSEGLGLIPLGTNPMLLQSMAELTLALVLFTDAAGADFGVLARIQRLPTRLLTISLPLTILAGTLVGSVIFPHWPLLEVALLATILAPTDAALGQAVVTNQAVPKEIREALKVESGLNDGICVPVLLLFLALIAGIDTSHSPLGMGLHLFVEEVGIGLIVGLVLTGCAAWLANFSREQGWTSQSWNNVLVVGLAFSCFGTAQALGGSGFIASFVGGLFFGAIYKDYHKELVEVCESIGGTFAFLTWTLFGAMIVSNLFGQLSVSYVLFALLSLTVIRMLPTFLSLQGLGCRVEQKLFIGWFGPRGLASIVFVVIILGEENLQHANEISLIVACAVTLSVILHGVSANPWSKRIGRS